jgi:hypothetical protein
LGQEKEVTIYKLITKDSCEEDIMQMASEKTDLNDAMLNEGKYSNNDADQDEESPADFRALLESMMKVHSAQAATTAPVTQPPKEDSAAIIDLSDVSEDDVL